MMYTVFEAFKLSGGKAIFSSDDIMECRRFEDAKRREYRWLYGDDFFTIINCWTRSDEELEKERKVVERWNKLTEEQKHEFIEVDGKKYVKSIYEAVKEED